MRTLFAFHLGYLKDSGRLSPEHVSLGKLGNVERALEVARSARQAARRQRHHTRVPLIRHLTNLETVVTYEGTADIHALVVGGALTGIQALR